MSEIVSKCKSKQFSGLENKVWESESHLQPIGLDCVSLILVFYDSNHSNLSTNHLSIGSYGESLVQGIQDSLRIWTKGKHGYNRSKILIYSAQLKVIVVNLSQRTCLLSLEPQKVFQVQTDSETGHRSVWLWLGTSDVIVLLLFIRIISQVSSPRSSKTSRSELTLWTRSQINSGLA